MHRPRKLSVTEVETWLRDPYAIYARRILDLKALRPLDEETDAADYGMLVHDGLHRFLREHGTGWPADAAERLRAAMNTALSVANLRAALARWWEPRLGRIAAWVAETEVVRRAQAPLVEIATELSGELLLGRPGGAFRLVGRADRIERRADQRLAILDYKTGAPPEQKDVDAGLAPQLLLEAAMAAAGGFGPAMTGTAAELAYWHLTGAYLPGEARPLFKGDPAKIAQAVADASNSLAALIDDFDRPERCYLAQPVPDRAPRFSDYAQLARVAEWSAAGDDP
jgi:ATP-dependent helicase/nuclease subunit B